MVNYKKFFLTKAEKRVTMKKKEGKNVGNCDC